MKPIEIEGRVLTKSDLNEIRNEVIVWRDEAMKQWPESIPFTVSASHVIFLLAKVIEQYPDEVSR